MSEISALKDKAIKTEKQHQEQKALIEKYEQQADFSRRKLQESKDATDAFRQEKAQLERKISLQQKEIESLKEDIISYKAIPSNLENKIKVLQTNIEHYKAENARLEKQLGERNKKLELEVTTSRQEDHVSKSKYFALTQEVESLSNSLIIRKFIRGN